MKSFHYPKENIQADVDEIKNILQRHITHKLIEFNNKHCQKIQEGFKQNQN